VSRWLSILAVAAALMLSWSEPARADEARDAYDRGVKAFDAGRYVDAAVAFRKAYDLKHSWKIQYNVGQSEAAAKRYGLALDAFEAYLAGGGDDVESARRDEVLAEIQRLRLLVGGIEFEGPAGATVVIDGMERGKLPLGARIRETAGVDHEVVIRAEDGTELLRRTGIRVGSGEVVTVKIAGEEAAPGPSSQAQTAAPQPAGAGPAQPGETAHGALWTWGWVAIGVGAATAIAGGVTGGMALSKQSDLEGACPGKTCTSEKDLELRDSASALGLVTDILIPVGAAVAVAGAILLIVDRKGGSERATALVTPQIGGSGAGLSVEGRF
jgi:hypothetical protein